MIADFSVLLTRPEPVSHKTAALFEASGIEVLKEPLMGIVPVPCSGLLLKPYQAILATSSIAIRAFACLSSDRDIPLWCVGEISKQTALELGFKNIYIPAGREENARGLIELIKETADPNLGPLLYIRGDHIQTDLKEILNTFGYIIDSIVLYKTESRESFSDRARQFLLTIEENNLKAVTFFSLRTVDIFLKLCQKDSVAPAYEKLIALSLSDAISKELAKLPWFKIITASTTVQLIANVIEIIRKGDTNDNDS